MRISDFLTTSRNVRIAADQASYENEIVVVSLINDSQL